MSQILLKLWLIGNRTSCRPIRSVIILVIKQIGLPLRGSPILLITRMITDRIGLHSVLLPLLIFCLLSSKNFATMATWRKDYSSLLVCAFYKLSPSIRIILFVPRNLTSGSHFYFSVRKKACSFVIVSSTKF